MPAVSRPLLLLMTALVAAGCAARTGERSAGVHGALAEGARLEEEGCYECLLRADGLYARALERWPRHERLIERRARVQALLAFRALEIGVIAAPVPERAPVATLAPPAVSPLRDALRLVTPHPSLSATPEFAAPQTRGKAVTELLPSVLASVAATPGDPAMRYVDVALRCEHRHRITPPAWSIRDEATPLLAWKRATCGELDPARLGALEAHSPHWVEASYLLAVLDLREGNLDSAFARLEPAADRLPGWVAAWMTLGTLHLAREEYDEAVRRFEQVVSRVPGQREALSGTLVALSYSGRHDRAIGIADHMIALGMYRMADAYFWRAWNLARLSRYDEAADSIERARSMMTSADFHKLAALVERARGQLEAARRDIDRALDLAPDDCDAQTEKGAIELAEQRWPFAARQLSAAHACYTVVLNGLDSPRPAPDSDLERRRRERQVAEARAGRARASLGAAQAYALSGNVERARAVITTALEHAETAPAARQFLERLPPPL